MELSERILNFVDKYAKISPNWNNDEDDEKYTAPDVYQLLDCVNSIQNNTPIFRCWSDWGCGGYSPYTSKEGKEEHDFIIKEINKIINLNNKL